MYMHYCKKCATEFNLQWDEEVMGQCDTCSICGILAACVPVEPKDILKQTADPLCEKNDGYVDPVYEMPDGDIVDLSKLISVSAMSCNLSWLQVKFTYYLLGHKDSYSQTRQMANNEIISVPTTKGTETFAKLIDGSQVSVNTRDAIPVNQIFAAKNFEVERQKFIKAWRRYKRYALRNKIDNDINLKDVLEDV